MTSVASATSESGSDLSVASFLSPLFCRNFPSATFLPQLFCRCVISRRFSCSSRGISASDLYCLFRKNQKFLEKDLEVKEKSVPMQPASEKGCSELLRGRKKFLKNLKKICGIRKSSYLCSPRRSKTGIAENEKRSLTRLRRTSTSKYRNKNL